MQRIYIIRPNVSVDPAGMQETGLTKFGAEEHTSKVSACI